MLASEPHAVFTRMLEPSWSRIRDQWAQGSITTARLTICSEVLVRIAWDLLRLARPAARRGYVVTGAWRGERDQLSGLGPVFAAQAEGYEAVSLGADASPSVVRDAVALLRPVLVLLTVTDPPSAPQARADCDDYAQANAPWAVAGPGAAAIETHVRRAGGHVLSDRAPKQVRALLDDPP
jgi:hypothetical protein